MVRLHLVILEAALLDKLLAAHKTFKISFQDVSRLRKILLDQTHRHLNWFLTWLGNQLDGDPLRLFEA